MVRMAFTRHGHHIPNSPLPEDDSQIPQLVARCGGPKLCPECRKDVGSWRYKEMNENGPTVESVDRPHDLFQFFEFGHLHDDLKTISRPFRMLAESLDVSLRPGSQKDLALTHLLQAKDAAVRSHLSTLNKDNT